MTVQIVASLRVTARHVFSRDFAFSPQSLVAQSVSSATGFKSRPLNHDLTKLRDAG